MGHHRPIGWSRGVVPDLAERVAAELGVDSSALSPAAWTVHPSARWRTPSSRRPTCARLPVTATPPAGAGVLLDDRRLSGWTLAMVGGQLRRAGAKAVVPLTLATLM